MRTAHIAGCELPWICIEIRAWISNYINTKVDTITKSSLTFNGSLDKTVLEFRVWMSNYNKTINVITYPCPHVSSSVLVKGVPTQEHIKQIYIHNIICLPIDHHNQKHCHYIRDICCRTSYYKPDNNKIGSWVALIIDRRATIIQIQLTNPTRKIFQISPASFPTQQIRIICSSLPCGSEPGLS